MRSLKPFLAAALLLALAPVAGAANQAATDLEIPAAPPSPSAAVALDDLFAAESGCGDAEPAVAALDGQTDEIQLATQYCGACSVPACQGARRGQGCGWDSGGQKHCNIFSGGFMCPTGWWECQCQSGDLP